MATIFLFTKLLLVLKFEKFIIHLLIIFIFKYDSINLKYF